VVRILKKAEEALGVALFCVILLAILWQIASRYFLNAPPSWTEELSRLLFIYMGTIGVHLSQRDFTHVRIDMVVTNAKPKPRRIVEAVILLVSIVAMVVLAWYSLGMTIRKAPIHLVSLGVSSAFMFVNAVLVSVLCAATMLRQFVAIVLGRQGEVYATESPTGEES